MWFAACEIWSSCHGCYYPILRYLIYYFHVLGLQICCMDMCVQFWAKWPYKIEDTIIEGHVIYLRFDYMEFCIVFIHILHAMKGNSSKLIMKAVCSCLYIVVLCYKLCLEALPCRIFLMIHLNKVVVEHECAIAKGLCSIGNMLDQDNSTSLSTNINKFPPLKATTKAATWKSLK